MNVNDFIQTARPCMPNNFIGMGILPLKTRSGTVDLNLSEQAVLVMPEESKIFFMIKDENGLELFRFLEHEDKKIEAVQAFFGPTKKEGFYRAKTKDGPCIVEVKEEQGKLSFDFFLRSE